MVWDWLKRKESLWAQKSRAQWLKEGDKNSRYFHSLASIRKRKNAIESITMNGTVIDSPSEIKKAAAEYFKSIFTEKHQKGQPFKTSISNALTIPKQLHLPRLSRNLKSMMRYHPVHRIRPWGPTDSISDL